MSTQEKLASDWTADDGSLTYDLPGGQTVSFRRDVSYGEQMELDLACKNLPDEAAFAKRLAFFITGWSLTYPNGTPLPIAEESIQALGMRRIPLLLAALQKHMETVKETYDDPLSDADSNSASPSAE